MIKEKRLKTTKAERLHIFLTEIMDKYEAKPNQSPSQNAAHRMAEALCYLSKMSDDDFNIITYGSKDYIDGYVIGDGT